ncbi:GNAT family N-acetyltransferase [Candidatus Riflebacteria bacterium]
MDTVCLHDKVEIEKFLRKNPFLHIYSIGDLDDFFWPYTTWYGLIEDDEIQEIALLYSGLSLPTLIAFSEGTSTYMQDLLASIILLLPRRFYAHLSPGLEKVLSRYFTLQSQGRHYKMALKNKAILKNVNVSDVEQLSIKDLNDLLGLYEESYPDNWFNPQILETNLYFGIRRLEGVVSVAGVHVISKKYKVAALGNITTHPGWRGKGFGKAVSAKLCQTLLPIANHIGLNVKANNKAAIACYKKLGFEIISTYDEYVIE